jgi:hypothetical protein
MRWADSDYQAVVKTLAVVCEVTGAEFSDAAKKLILDHLQGYSPNAVMRALNRCAVTCKHRLTLADVVEQVESQRYAIPDAKATRRMLDERDRAWKTEKRLGGEDVKQLVGRITKHWSETEKDE